MAPENEYQTALERTDAALAHLMIARDLLKQAGAVKTLARVRLAISSCKGAVRHASLEPIRKERQARP